MFKIKFINKKFLNFFTYFLAVLVSLIIVYLLGSITNLGEFFSSMENKTFDLRQKIAAQSSFKQANSQIVILAIDDASYEYILNNYGDWPAPRGVYAKVVDYIESQQPKSIAFDLMFLKSIKTNAKQDEAVSAIFGKYNNVYTAINFDDQPQDVRKPVDLPKKLQVQVENQSKIDFSQFGINYANCRAIIPQIINATKNIGHINVSREEDGVLRKMPLFVQYKNNFYPHLSFLVGLNAINKDKKIDTQKFYVNKNSELVLGDKKIPIDSDGGAILNWYGASKTFEHIPFYQVLMAANGEKRYQYFNFKNKIVYIGTTATSLYDTKSVPVDKVYPGVEIHTTYVNNIIDGNFIKKVSPIVNTVISLTLALLVGYLVITTSSTVLALASTLALGFWYIIFSYYSMKFFNMWFALILPISGMILMFVLSYVLKYLLKSRDFEEQYKLATTDGLTELYNHRYFQEQMIMQIENAKRYEANFSLILIDIDFFKKFNDTYGHQAGDAVLKQVAQVLKKNVRATDIVCRYGGEEMSIILSNTDRDEAIITAQKICQTVAKKPFKIAADVETPVTISLGVATFPQDGSSPSELIEKADKGLYNAKENGRNQVGE